MTVATTYSSEPVPTHPNDIHPNDIPHQNYQAPIDGAFNMGLGEVSYPPSLYEALSAIFLYPPPFYLWDYDALPAINHEGESNGSGVITDYVDQPTAQPLMTSDSEPVLERDFDTSQVINHQSESNVSGGILDDMESMDEWYFTLLEMNDEIDGIQSNVSAGTVDHDVDPPPTTSECEWCFNFLDFLQD